jgi:hypothetical protein
MIVLNKYLYVSAIHHILWGVPIGKLFTSYQINSAMQVLQEILTQSFSFYNFVQSIFYRQELLDMFFLTGKGVIKKLTLRYNVLS